MSKYQLGDRVRFYGVIDKYREGGLTIFRAAPTPYDYSRNDCRRLTEGVVVGMRTVANGRTRYSAYSGAKFVPDSATYQSVYLVAFHLRRKPLMCTEGQLTPIEAPDA